MTLQKQQNIVNGNHHNQRDLLNEGNRTKMTLNLWMQIGKINFKTPLETNT